MQHNNILHNAFIASGILLSVSLQTHASPVSHTENATGHDIHRHASWPQAPSRYLEKTSNQWANPAAIVRGQTLYLQNCVSCHGGDGKGDSASGKTLAHQPADLINHFHQKPGDGDAYLLWRIREGGLSEPFKPMKSAMPVFNNTMSEQDRWDVLAYIHAFYHLRLSEWNVNDLQSDVKVTTEKSHDHDSHQHN